MGAWVYIMSNRQNGALYIGVPANLTRRIWEHREGVAAGHPPLIGAIQREKNIKHWPRAWKVRLIPDANSEWADLYEFML